MMRKPGKLLITVLGALSLAACHKAQPQQNQDISFDDNLAMQEGLPANADIETLPADESSTTPSNQLQKGYDNPDVNDLGNGN